jgi:DNA-3-methyladenine glycosylase II
VYGHKDIPKPKLILEHGERWRPYRSIACWYLWRALEEKQTKPKRQMPKRQMKVKKISAGR